jgi:hypothetical protein
MKLVISSVSFTCYICFFGLRYMFALSLNCDLLKVGFSQFLSYSLIE